MTDHGRVVNRKRHVGFQGFGPSILANSARRPMQHVQFSNDLTEARSQIRQSVPVCPGVYGWLNPDRSLIYVGKSKSLRHRLVSYFATETTDPKMARIRRQGRTLVWEPISHDLLSLIRESELIERFRPPFNVQGQPDRQQPGFICVSKGAAPNLFFARQVPKRAALAFGPIAGRARLSEAITCLNYVFQLRDCSDKVKMQFNNQLQLFGNDYTPQCIRFELNTCTGPCAGNCSSQAYRYNVDQAIKFLRGRDLGSLRRLDERMQTAAQQLSFERACVLRDQLAQLKWLHRRIRQITNARRKLHGCWRMDGFDHQTHWLILQQGRLVDCREHIESQDLANLANISCQLDLSDHLDINLQMLLSGWIRKHPDQLNVAKFDGQKDIQFNGEYQRLQSA